MLAATIGGYRIQSTALLGGTQFEEFHLDIANIDQAKALAIPQELQFAEKLHAYTHHREDRENTREKDLIDMVILISRDLDPEETKVRVHSVFAARKTHELPIEINRPPSSWGKVFAKHAEELNYPGTLEDAFNSVNSFYESHLAAKQK